MSGIKDGKWPGESGCSNANQVMAGRTLLSQGMETSSVASSKGGDFGQRRDSIRPAEWIRPMFNLT